MTRCGIKHGFSDALCIREHGHDGLCRSRASRRVDIGTIMYSEWVSRDGKFYSHMGYTTIYPRNAVKTVAVILLLAFASTAAAQTSPVIAELYKLQNAERTSRGLPRLGIGAKMATTAQSWADYMAATGYWGHQDVAAALNRAGVRWSAAGENIAQGQTTAAWAISSWMRSPGHRANILGDYTHAGAGLARGRDGRLWWVMTFAKQQRGAAASSASERQQDPTTRVAAPTLQGAVCRPGMPCAKPAKQPARRGLFGRRG